MSLGENELSKGKFLGLVLLIWLIFLLVAGPQWMIICLYAKQHVIYTLVLLLIGCILLICIHCIEPLKYRRPWNYICIIICYELLTLGVSTFLARWDLIKTFIIIAVGLLLSAFALIISLVLILIGRYPNPSKMAVVGVLGFILVFCIGSINIFVTWFYLMDVVVSVFLASVIIVMVCHVLITNDNFELLNQDDAVLVAFVLFLCYLLFLVGCRIAAYCIISNMQHMYPEKGFGITLAEVENKYSIFYI